MYDAEGYQVANAINRFAIGDRDKLKFNADGSLDITIQHADPGPEKQSNWLPSPASGELGVTMRLYALGRGARRLLGPAAGREAIRKITEKLAPPTHLRLNLAFAPTSLFAPEESRCYARLAVVGGS